MTSTDDPHGPGVTGAVSRISSQVVSSLKPQFLALILVNAIFMGVFIWYIDARARHAAEIMRQLFETCLKDKT